MEKQFVFADVGEGITEGVLVKWRVAVGDVVCEDQPLVDVETDKAIVEIPAPFSGKILKLHVRAGETVKVGQTLVSYETDEVVKTSTLSQAAPVSPMAITEPSAPRTEKRVVASPYVRRLARELGIDLSSVSPDPQTGRVTEERLRLQVQNAGRGKEPPVHTPTAVELDRDAIFPHIDFASWGPIERVPMVGIRSRIAQRMTMSQREIPHVHHMDEADATALLQIKEKVAQQTAIKLTFLPFIMKTVVQALMRFPMLNASLDNQDIVYRRYYNLGFAANTTEGLLVPVIKNVDQKSILQIAEELNALSEKARRHSISREEMAGHTFSITNIGSIGGKFFTPIIHYPNTAILGVGKIYKKPVVVDDQVQVRSVVPLVVTFDHRVLDGATAAMFLNDIIRHLQDPHLLLVDIK